MIGGAAEPVRTRWDLGRAALWIACSGVLAVVGFGAIVLALPTLARALGSVDAGDLQQFRVMLAFYFKIVCFRGLLPGLAILFALWPALLRVAPGVTASRPRLLAGCVGLAALAYAIVAPLLLTADLGGGGVLRMQTWADHVGSAVGVIGGVALCAWLPRALLPWLRRGDP